MKLMFLGANRQVTGSRYCLQVGRRHLMIDCGLFQEREFAMRNWERCPIPAGKIEALLLTHAHIDHSGLIPRFVREGYAGKIYATRPTVELAEVMLRDSAQIQEEDRQYKRKRHAREGRGELPDDEPLYTLEDAEEAMRRFRGVDYGEPIQIADSIRVTWHDAGHILGSAILEVVAEENGQRRTIVFSGDIGQWDKPLMNDPTLLSRADYVIMESTYGDRDHQSPADVPTELARIINDATVRGGKVIIPTFAVERAQELVYHISELVHAGRIQDVPVFLDSPMAVEVTEIFQRHQHLLDATTRARLLSPTPPLDFPNLFLSSTAQESRAINAHRGPCVIMATSGMCTAGRIKHHLTQTLGNRDNTILFVGYQGQGTLGRQILERKPEVRIHGRMYRVNAQIEKINGFSAHAGRSDLLRWIGAFDPPPRQTFLTHGEETVSLRLAETLRQQLRLHVAVPQYDTAMDLD